MNKKSNGRFIAGFAAAIILVLVVGISSYHTLSKQAEQEVWVAHTYKVMSTTGYIEQLTIDMETGRRGFRATGEKQFLEPYYNSLPKVALAIADLKQLVNDRPEQVKRTNQLEKDLDKVTGLWKSINVDSSYTDVQKKVITSKEKQLVDVVRADIAAIGETEQQLLGEREKSSEAAIEQAIWTLVVGIAFILLLVFALIWLIISEFRSRVKAQDALKDKLAELERINIETQEKNWMLAGIREINASLIGNDSLQSLSRSSLVKIADYMGIPAAAFYFYDKDTRELRLTAALAAPADVSKAIKINEGIVGRAAAQKGITIVNDVPPTYWKISSASGSTVPDTVVCIPLWQKNELKGVIELACFAAMQQRNINLLTAVSDNLAVGLAAAHAGEVMARLLAQVQEQKEELESQQEELRQTNEELTHQAEVLRASEEELKTQEEELRQINVELEEKTEAVEMARKALAVKAVELEASSKYKSEFLANMSHELRTPLNSLLILANLLKENKTGNLTDKQIEYARIILKSGSDLLNLINDILDLSKIEAGKVEMQVEPVKIAEIAADMEQLFVALAAEKKIDFGINIAEDLPELISTDRQRVGQVVKNLLSNAFKFTPAGGRVALSFATRAGSIAIAVADTGIGIPPEKQQLIFEAFQQADGSTSRKFGGTGLGLSISKELVRRLGGEIMLSSEAGAGSVFTIVLPLDGASVPPSLQAQSAGGLLPVYREEDVVEQTLIKDNKTEVNTGDQSILIIEDDTVFAGIVNDFAHSKGYKTIIAISGDEGLFYARKYKPAAIILDLGLPVIDGKSILKILKSDAELKNIPVHVITAEDRDDIPLDVVESYFRKPLKANDLEAAFSNIDSYIKDHYRNIMIISAGNELVGSMFGTLIREKNKGIAYDTVPDLDGARDLLLRKEYDCIIVNIDSELQEGIAILQNIRNIARQGVYIITFLDRDISTGDEMQLRKYVDSIIRKSTQATSRLMDEVELFLHKIKTPQQRVAIPAQFGNRELDKSLSKKKVLLADDDMRNVFALTALLEEQGMEIVAAENGREAVDLLEQNKDVDIVLMDIMMPEMDGYEAMERIRADKRYKQLPIIALTAKAMTGDREKCLAAGASDYITKPVDSGKLFSLMRVWLAQ